MIDRVSQHKNIVVGGGFSGTKIVISTFLNIWGLFACFMNTYDKIEFYKIFSIAKQ